ncbi:MAG: NUDIX domain-containing protein [Fimbriimonadaceae bacterium]
MSRPYEIVAVERVYDGFFAVDRAQVKFGLVHGGMSETHERLAVERGDSVAVLIHSVERATFLFARQFRFPCVRHGDAWLMEAFAGKIDVGETPEDAIRREALEEAGYRLAALTKVGAFYGSPGGLSELTHVFYAGVGPSDRVADGGGSDAGEDVEIVSVPCAEAVRMALAGEVRDGKALVALLWFAARVGPA